MSIEIIITIYCAALAILVLEVFVPSGGVLAVLGGLGLAVSIYYGFQESALLGVGQILVSIIAIPLLFYYGLKKMTLDKKLDTEEGFRSEKGGMDYLVSKEGVALTALRPSGTVIIEGKRYDVVTEGEMIDKDTPVKVTKIEGARIIVRKRQHE
ncbi:MAG: NfeD family protein [Planctomycetota bacterium]